MKTADWLREPKEPKEPSTEPADIVGIREASRLAGVTEQLLALWVKTGRVGFTQDLSEVFGPGRYLFDEAAIVRIRQHAEGSRTVSSGKTKPKSGGVKGANAANTTDAKEWYSVADIAVLMNLSTDSIRRMFQDEPGVVVVSDGRASRGKRKRVTLRIPKSVLERVQRKRAKK
jgi:hypothetical protein